MCLVVLRRKKREKRAPSQKRARSSLTFIRSKLLLKAGQDQREQKMVVKTKITPGVITPIGPHAWYLSVPGSAPVVLHRHLESETATADDALLVGVVAWVRALDSDRVRLFGVWCVVELRVRLTGRWYLAATMPSGEVRILESRTMIAVAEAMFAPVDTLGAWEMPW